MGAPSQAALARLAVPGLVVGVAIALAVGTAVATAAPLGPRQATATETGAPTPTPTSTSTPDGTDTPAPPASETPAPTASATPDGPVTPVPDTEPTPYDIVFTAEGLRPAILAVPVGGTVRWVNETSDVHNTTHVPDLGEPALWGDDVAPDGGEFRYTFGAVGTFSYIDARFPDDLDFQGRVVVVRNDPTATPLTPTVGPSPTEGPTVTPREPSPTVPPTPTRPEPTRAPVALYGTLLAHDDPARPCGIDARLFLCNRPGTSVLVSTEGRIGALFGYDVRLEGVMTTCAASGDTYLWMSTAQTLPGGCAGLTATPSPTPTATVRPPINPSANLAAGRPVVARAPQWPGFEPPLVTDGDAGTAWYSADETAWIYVDLGESRTFNQVRLRWGDPYAARYGIYVSQGGAWRGVFVADSNRGGEDVRNLSYTEARYVLLYLMRSSSPAGGFALREFEVYGADRPNWALGQPVVVSSETDGYEGMYATDGKLGTWWLSRQGDANPWIGVYLPESVQLIEFKLHWTTRYPRLYSLVFFEQGRATFSAPIRSTSDGVHHFRGTVPVRADTLMVYTHENAPEGQIGLQEIELYGPGPGLIDLVPEDGYLRLRDLRAAPPVSLDALAPGPARLLDMPRRHGGP